MVESIDHYLLRLAWITGISRRQILRMGAGCDSDVGQPVFRSGYSYECAPDYLLDLEELTGVTNLRHGTFWALKEVLSARPFGRTRNFRRWCPVCYRDWDVQTSVEPLVFSVALCLRCPQHGCELEESCVHCGAHQSPGTLYKDRRRCIACGQSLGHDGKCPLLSKLDEWANGQVVKLVELCTAQGAALIPRESFATYIADLKCAAADEEAAPMLLEQVGKFKAMERPSIRTLINCAALQGVSVIDILLQSREAATKPLLDQWAERSILPLDMGQVTTSAVEVLKVCRRLMQYSSIGFIPPLEFVTRDLHFHSGNLRELRLDIYQKYCQKYLDQAAPPERFRLETAFKIALAYLVDMPASRTAEIRWRLHCMVAQYLDRTRDEVAHACNGALAYYRLAKPAKERLGLAAPIVIVPRAYKGWVGQTHPSRQMPLFS